MPKAIVEKLNAGIRKACASPIFQAKLAALEGVCAAGTTEEFAQFVTRERAKWGDIVRKSGAKID